MNLLLVLLVLTGLTVANDNDPTSGSRIRRSLCLFLLAALASTTPAFAVGARPQGMGSAYLAIADDENAIFFNVAGLSQLDKDLTQVSSQVLNRNEFRLDSISYAGKIYSSSDKKKLTLEEYLESDYNFKSEVQKVSNYAWGTAASHELRSLNLNQLSGQDPPSRVRKNTAWMGFATRFPIAERLTRRPELYGGLRIRYEDFERSIPSLSAIVEQDIINLDVHMFYRANSRMHLGAAIDNVLSSTDNDAIGARNNSAIFSLGGAYYYGEKRDTILAIDFGNIFDAERGVQQPKIRVGAERQFLDNDFVFRIGSNDGLLTLGVGVRFWEEFRLDYAFERGQVIDEHQVSLRTVF